MKKVFLVAILIISSFSFESCKKGEDDPFFSVRSRKNRVVGEWKLVSGYYEQNENTVGGTTLNMKFDLTESGAHLYFSVADATYYGYGSDNVWYSEKFAFNADGTFTHYMKFDTDTWNETGMWNFTGKVGDERKNKSELLLMFNESISNYYGKETWSGEVNSFVYDIVELRHKRLVLRTSWKYYDDVEQKTLYYTEHKIFVPVEE